MGTAGAAIGVPEAGLAASTGEAGAAGIGRPEETGPPQPQARVPVPLSRRPGCQCYHGRIPSFKLCSR